MAVTSVHKTLSELCRRSGRNDMRGVGYEFCSVRAHRLELFYPRFHSRFAPGFTPDSRSNSIALRRTHSGNFTHTFNANIVHGLTPSHAIPISTDRPFKARTEPSAQASPRVRLPRRRVCCLVLEKGNVCPIPIFPKRFPLHSRIRRCDRAAHQGRWAPFMGRLSIPSCS